MIVVKLMQNITMRILWLTVALLLSERVLAQTTQWHTTTLRFRGPESSETGDPNPFTDYRLLVKFSHPDVTYLVRGFYAADGDAAQSGAGSGNVWQVRFSPDRPGRWSYSASLRKGPWIAVTDDPDIGIKIPIDDATGSFRVAAAQPRGSADFRERGRLVADGQYLRFAFDGPRLLKGGANSPENLLAFVDFDGTERQQAEARDGEAAPPSTLHAYAPHVSDWRPGDPSWRDGKGKGLIGAINYLASMGMNSVYFLTLNIGGDGKDVWPYADPSDFSRFDCSKLDQWEIVFEHMQRRGIILHMVTQETENERLLDNGDVGDYRKLYYRELIARFAHHPALIWNLGEENGPAEFSPNGQTSDQQKAMASYLRDTDPYHHPIVIHTHSTPKSKDELLTDLLGHQPLDGLSFQVNERQQVNRETIKWIQLAADESRPWMITMDEIGQWHTGALTDQEDPHHDSLRRHVLWGSLMAGAAGVEWYFGARHPHNDLTSEDWRQRSNLWSQTRYAMDFFAALPYWEMKPMNELTPAKDDYCFAKPGELFVIYSPTANRSVVRLDLGPLARQYSVQWFDPMRGKPLRGGTLKQVEGPGIQELGGPPAGDVDRDWVILVRAAD